MKAVRQLSVTLLALTAVVASGCGRSMPMSSAVRSTASTSAIMASGHSVKLGYNYKRYVTMQRPSAHPQHIVTRGPLKASADNRQFCAPIYDQGQLGSCTAFSMAKGLREFLQRKNGEQPTPLSALAFYYQERVDQDTVNEDSGATITEGMTLLKNWGAPPEADCPYDISKFTQKPSDKAFADAAANKVNTITQLAGVDDAKSAIASGHSVSIGFIVYESIRQATKPGSKGIIPVPKRGEQILGGHAVELVGYDDKTKLFTVRNSWGTAVADKGYFYMPYDFVSGSTDGQQNVMEIWTAE